MNSGELAIDIDAPAGDFYVKGWRVSAVGAIYGNAVPDGAVYSEGIMRNADGSIVYEPADPTVFANRNPLTINDRLSVD